MEYTNCILPSEMLVKPVPLFQYPVLIFLVTMNKPSLDIIILTTFCMNNFCKLKESLLNIIDGVWFLLSHYEIMGWHFSGNMYYLMITHHTDINESHWRIKPLRAKFFRGNIHKHIFTFHVFHPHWYDTGGCNLFSSKTRTYLFYIVNIMAADVLATQGARASSTMVLT